jgi:hypothetical protein
MQRRIAPPDYGGEYDEEIEWLKWLEETLTKWQDGKPVQNAVHSLNEYSRHEHKVTWRADSYRWTQAQKQDRGRTMKWLPVGEAVSDLINSLERTIVSPPTSWQEHIENVRECRNHLAKNNPPKENPIKY